MWYYTIYQKIVYQIQVTNAVNSFNETISYNKQAWIISNYRMRKMGKSNQSTQAALSQDFH